MSSEWNKDDEDRNDWNAPGEWDDAPPPPLGGVAQPGAPGAPDGTPPGGHQPADGQGAGQQGGGQQGAGQQGAGQQSGPPPGSAGWPGPSGQPGPPGPTGQPGPYTQPGYGPSSYGQAGPSAPPGYGQQPPGPYGNAPQGGAWPAQQGGAHPPPGPYGTAPQGGAWPAQQGGANQPPGPYGNAPQGGAWPEQQGGAPQPQAGYGAGPPQPWVQEKPGRSRKPLVIGLVGLLVLLLGAGAFAAVRFLAGSPDTLAQHVPADAVTYLHVNLDPAGSQKLGLVSLVERVNDAADEDLLSFEMFESQMGADTDISFADDIQPWLGTQAAVFLSAVPAPDSADTPDFAILIDVDDADAAAAFVESEGPFPVWDAGDGVEGWVLEEGDPAGVAVIVDDVLYGGTEAGVRSALGAEESLVDNPVYAASIEQLPDRVLTGWVDIEALFDSLGSEVEPFRQQVGDVGQTAFALSFEDDAIQISSVQTGQNALADMSGTTPLDQLPAGGLLYGRFPEVGPALEMLVQGLDEQQQLLDEEFGDSGLPLPSEEVDQVLMEFGTSVSEIGGLIGDLTFALDFDAAQATDNVAGLVQLAVDDEARATELLDQIGAEIPSDSGITVESGSISAGAASASVSDGQFAIQVGTFGDELLGADQAYQAAVAGTESEALFYVDMRGVAEQIGLFAGAEGDIQQDELQALNIFGAFDSVIVSSEVGEEQSLSSLRITFESEYTDVPLGQQANPPDLDFGDLGGLQDLLGGGGGGGTDQLPEPGLVNTFGDDPVLDELWIACENGDGVACDDLWFSSPIDSEYESFADTCGNAPGIEPGSAGRCDELLGQ